MGLTLVEKIAGRHADGLAPGTMVRSGDFISIRPRHVMTHDNTGAVIPKFREVLKGFAVGGVHVSGEPRHQTPKIHESRHPVFAIDHDIQNT